MGTTIRLLVTAIIVAATYGGVHVIREAGVPREVRLPRQDLGTLPIRLRPWIGEEVPLDPETFPNAGADSTVTRMYRNATGEMVSVYAAVWLEYHIGTPHPPEACYGASGYRIISEENVQLQAQTS